MKRFFLIYLAAMAALAFAVSCDQLQGNDDPNDPDKAKMEFPDGSGVTLDENDEGTLRMKATHYWKAEFTGSDTSWLTMDPMSSEEGGEFTLRFKANSKPANGENRAVEVVFTVGTDHHYRANVFQNSQHSQGGSIFVGHFALNPEGPLDLVVGDTRRIGIVDITPWNANELHFRWEVSDAEKLEVAPSNDTMTADIKALASGSVHLTVWAAGENGCKADMDITIR